MNKAGEGEEHSSPCFGGPSHLADEEEDVAHVGPDRARVVNAPLELVHEPEALTVEIDRDELAVGIEHGRAGVAADCIGGVADAARRAAHIALSALAALGA